MNDGVEGEGSGAASVHSFVSFLETSPLMVPTAVFDLSSRDNQSEINAANIYLHCKHEKCSGIKPFACSVGRDAQVSGPGSSFLMLSYYCTHCRESHKAFWLFIAYVSDDAILARCTKIAELPPREPIISSNLMRLIGPSHHLFLAGWTSETQGLGLGAINYYLRVLQLELPRILKTIVEVVNRHGFNAKKTQALYDACAQDSVVGSLEIAKDAIPACLWIDEHNSVELLLDAIRAGIKNVDEEGLVEIAGCMRQLLIGLAEKISSALRDREDIGEMLLTLKRA